MTSKVMVWLVMGRVIVLWLCLLRLCGHTRGGKVVWMRAWWIPCWVHDRYVVCVSCCGLCLM